MSQLRFHPYSGPLEWEGLVLPGIERGQNEFRQLISLPSTELRDFIQMYWIFSWDLPDGHSIPAIVVPTPCHSIGALKPSTPLAPMDLWVYSASPNAHHWSLQGSGLMLGIQFKPGGFSPFISKADVSDLPKRVALETIWKDHPKLPTRAIRAEDYFHWFESIDLALGSRDCDLKYYSILEKSLRQIPLDGETQLSVQLLAEAACVSESTLLRAFRKAVGLTPKEFLRLRRFHDTINAINREQCELLLNIAQDLGFFDEAHLNNEIKKLTGQSPSRFRKFM